MSKRERIAERANTLIARAASLLHEASGLADDCGDLYSCGRIDAIWEALESRDLVVRVPDAEEQK